MAFTLTAPATPKGSVTEASGNFSVNIDAGQTVVVTPTVPATDPSGTFTPSSLSWTGEGGAKTFVYTPIKWVSGGHSIAVTNNAALTNPTPVNYLAMVQLGQSGTGLDTGSGGGNISPSLGGFDPLANGSWLPEMKRDIRGDAVDPNSDAILEDWIAFDPGIQVAFRPTGAGTGGNGVVGMPFNIVPGTQPALDVTFDPYGAESDAGPYQIPPEGSYENTTPAEVPPEFAPGPPHYPGGFDRHIDIYIRNETTGGIDTLEDLYQAYTEDAGATFLAAGGSRFDLTTGYPRQDGWTSSDAAGLPITPLLTTYEEVARGDIGHTLRLTAPAGTLFNARWEWPGRHGSAGFIPYVDGNVALYFGSRLRLKLAWYDANKDSFTGHARIFVDGLRKYGGIISDITGGGLGTGPFLCAPSDDRWDSTILGQLHNGIPVSAFEVILQHPSYTVAGATSGIVGQPVTFTMSKYPLTDEHYDYTNAISVTGGDYTLSPTQLTLEEPGGVASDTFTFTPLEVGEYELSFSNTNGLGNNPPDISFTASADPDAPDNATIIDNADAECTFTGTWSPFSGGYDGGIRFNAGGTVAQWAFTGLTPGESRLIAMTWTAAANRATAAVWTILDSDGTTVLETAVLNQTIAPSDFFLGEVFWKELATVAPTETSLTIKLAIGPAGFTIADATLLGWDDPPEEEEEEVDRRDGAGPKSRSRPRKKLKPLYEPLEWPPKPPPEIKRPDFKRLEGELDELWAASLERQKNPTPKQLPTQTTMQKPAKKSRSQDEIEEELVIVRLLEMFDL